MGPPWRIDTTTYRTMSEISTTELQREIRFHWEGLILWPTMRLADSQLRQML